MDKQPHHPQVVDLDEEIVPAGALVETKQGAIHYITVLVIGLTLP
jgi:hypothetical protein